MAFPTAPTCGRPTVGLLPRLGRSDLAIVAMLVAAGTALFLFASRGGLNLSPDSVTYLDGARSLADGDGYTIEVGVAGRQAIGQLAPLYSVVLAAFEIVGVGVTTGARVLNCALYVGTAALLYVLVARLTGSRGLGLLSSGAFMLAPGFLALYGSALSEALFLFLLVSFFLVIDRHLDRPSPAITVLLAMVAALATLTRYVGLAIILSGVVTLLLVGGRDRHQRAKAATLFGGLALAPQLAWSVRNRVSDANSLRELDVHLLPLEEVEHGLGVLSDWFLPSPIPDVIRVVLFPLLVVSTALTAVPLVRRARPSRWRGVTGRQDRMLLALAAFVGSYLLVVVISASFLDAQTGFDDRILSPVLPAVLTAVTILSVRASRQFPPARRILGVFVLAVLALFAYRSADDVVPQPIRELGLTGSYYSGSRLMDIAAEAPLRTTIYSNRPEAISLNTGRRRGVELLPAEFDAHSLEANPRFRAQMRSMAERITDGRGILLHWDALGSRTYLPSREELASFLRSLDQRRFDEGVEFAAPPDGVG